MRNPDSHSKLIHWKPGKPTRLPLTSLFLLSPEVDLALAGLSLESGLRELFLELGKTPIRARLLARVVARLQLRLPSARSPARKALLELLASDIIPDLSEMMGCPYVPKWAATAAGARKAGFSWRAADFYARMEKNCAPAQLVITTNAEAAAEALTGLEMLAPVLWPGALKAFRLKRDDPLQEAAILMARLSILLEIRLAGLAIQEHQVQLDDDIPSFSLDAVLPAGDGPAEGPSACFALWLTRMAGIDPIEAILKDRRFDGLIHLNHTTVSRWKCGHQSIHRKHLVALAEQLPDDDRRWEAYQLLCASKHLNLLRQLWDHVAGVRANAPDQVALVVSLPHGHTDFSTWTQVRLAVWRQILSTG